MSGEIVTSSLDSDEACVEGMFHFMRLKDLSRWWKKVGHTFLVLFPSESILRFRH
jgi:hypothetical protein